MPILYGEYFSDRTLEGRLGGELELIEIATWQMRRGVTAPSVERLEWIAAAVLRAAELRAKIEKRDSRRARAAA